MIPIHPHLISQLIADRQAGLMAGARQQRLARQARGLDLLNLAAPALTHPDIARQPVPGGHTAHRHLASIFRTLSRSSRAAAAGGRPPGLVGERRTATP